MLALLRCSTWFFASIQGKPGMITSCAHAPVIISVFACKLKDLANSRGSYPLADMVTSDNTLDQVHSIFVRYICHNLDLNNSMCTYNITVNECILITAN